jgi:hypothetical protein
MTGIRLRQAGAALLVAILLVNVISLLGGDGAHKAVVLLIIDTLRSAGTPEPIIFGAVYLPFVVVVAVGAIVGWLLARPNPGLARKAFWWLLLAAIAAQSVQDLQHLIS